MNRPGFGGAPSSMNFSTRTTETSINGSSPSDLTEEDLDNLRIELSKTEDEIQTLRQVLLAKEKYAADIRRQLGLSPLSNIKQNLSKGWQEVQTSAPYLTATATLEDISHSAVYVRTREGLSHAGHVTSSALSSVGVAVTRRLAEMRALPLPSPPRALSHTISVPSMRPSNTFRSFEEMVGNVKDKVTGTLSNNGDTPCTSQDTRTFSVLELSPFSARATVAHGAIPHLTTAPGANSSIQILQVTIFHLRAVFHLRSEKMAAIPSSGSLIATHDYYRRRLGSNSSSSSCGSAEYTGEVIPHHPGLPRQDSGHWWTSFFFAKQNQPGMQNGSENQKNRTYTVANGQVTCIAREMVLNRQLSESSENGKSEPLNPPPTSS
ncbi:tumor protein D54-like isoform X2 [Lates japonicus]|uniref:Tumor protein D54-like isoform X2 n=1 Tax=Lates japonicus TaxID=270547 RepID=A0AAD3MAP8_LATJO|nr:tumor protein D54-like isoform X2 [Lates japonicus]